MNFIPARAARGTVVHLLPFENDALVSVTAKCGWTQKPRGSAPHRWYRDDRGANQCPKCFPKDQAR